MLWASEEDVANLDDSLDVWENKAFISLVHHDVLPLNLSGQQKHKLKMRARDKFKWKPARKVDGKDEYLRNKRSNVWKVYPSPGYRRQLLKRYHEEAHQQYPSLLARLSQHYFWNAMRDDIKDFLRGCQVCQNSTTMVTADRTIQSIPVLPKAERWHLDLIGPLVEGLGGYKYAGVAMARGQASQDQEG